MTLGRSQIRVVKYQILTRIIFLFLWWTYLGSSYIILTGNNSLYTTIHHSVRLPFHRLNKYLICGSKLIIAKHTYSAIWYYAAASTLAEAVVASRAILDQHLPNYTSKTNKNDIYQI